MPLLVQQPGGYMNTFIFSNFIPNLGFDFGLLI